MGPCTKLYCSCPEGISVDRVSSDEGSRLCQECDHSMGLHKSYVDAAAPSTAARTTTNWQWGYKICRREATVANLLNQVLQHRVVQVRGTPASGKTILSELLHDHIQSSKPDLIPIYITWRQPSAQHLAVDPHVSSYDVWLNVLSKKQLPVDFRSRNDVVLIIDEAQLSYAAHDFWVECVKRQAQETVGPYIVLFSSFGSADRTALKITDSAPINLAQEQRVSLTPQPHIHHKVSLCFTDNEIRDICTRITKGRFHIDQSLVDYILDWTSGHPGLSLGLLSTVIDLPAARCRIKAGEVIRHEDVAYFFESDHKLLTCIEYRVGRSLPTKGVLNSSEFPNIRDALLRAVQEGGITTSTLNAVPGLDCAYEMGYLQAEMVEEGNILYSFPSLLHKKYCQSLIQSDSWDGITYTTVKDLCFAAISQFSPLQLESHARKAPHSAINYAQSRRQAQLPEAQYADELYRCLYKVTDGKCIIHSEFSYARKGRIDYFLKSKKWGIEVLREGDRLEEHLEQFHKKDGKYGSWKLVDDWILLDFRQSEPDPRTRRNAPGLFTIIFAQGNESFRIWDSDHNEIKPPTQLFYR